MAWFTYRVRQTALTTGDAPPVTSIAVVNDEAAVAFTEGSTLKYARFDRATGSWLENTVTTGLALRCEIKLIDANGYPAIFYYSSSSLDFRFIKAANSLGTIWNSPIVVYNSSVSDSSYYGIGFYNTGGGYYGISFIGGNLKTERKFCEATSSDDGSNWTILERVYNANTTRTTNPLITFTPYPYCSVFSNETNTTIYASNGDGTITTVTTTVVNAKVVHLHQISNPVVYYTNGSSLYSKTSLNSEGSSWPASSTTMLSFTRLTSTNDIAGALTIAGSPLTLTPMFVYYSSTPNPGVYYYEGYNVKIIDGSDWRSNFSLAPMFTESTITPIFSYCWYNSTLAKYEVFVASRLALETSSIDSESSSSVYEKEYVYAFFENGSGLNVQNNLLNSFGNMRGTVFTLPGTVNTGIVYSFSGNGMHNLKLEDVDNHRTLCQFKQYGDETTFSTIPGNTRLRVFVDDGDSGDIINSYEVKFRFNMTGESSSITQSLESLTTESSQTNSTSSSSSSVSSSTVGRSSSISSSSMSSSSISSSSESSSSSMSSSSVSSSSVSSSTVDKSSSMSSSSKSSSSISSSSTGIFGGDNSVKIVANDAQAGDVFGYSVSISGDYAIVGAHREDAGGTEAGAAYIFHRTGTNTWDAGTKIVANDAQAGDVFGNSVSISGDYAIVGAKNEDAGGTEAGAAYIFHRTGTNTWDAGTKIVANDAQAGDVFGNSVSISGDYAIVGAHGEDAGGTEAGAAYIFHRTGTNTWDAGTKIVANDAQAADIFGHSVSISGDYAIVGAYAEDAGGTEAGAAYIFRRTGTNTWDAGTKIVASDAQSDDYFGISVSISGDYAIVGAYLKDTGLIYDVGAAYIFHRTGTNTWDSGTKIVASDAQQYDNFGNSVSISGDYAIVGAWNEDTGGTDAGASYIFHRTGTNTWDAGTKIVASDAQQYDYFGASVSISGDYAIVGAYWESTGGNGAGAAYIYYKS